MRLICLSGESGTGKTYWRNITTPDLPYVDIKDVYKDNPGIEWDEAFKIFLERVADTAGKGAEVIILEAYFRRNSKQREMIEKFAAEREGQVRYLEFTADYATCVERVMKDPDPVSRDARLKLLDQAKKERRLK